MLKGIFSYWMIPLFSAVVWLAMLLAMLVHWLTQGKPHLESMVAGQDIAYISDVGATSFKPLFIAMGTTSVVTFDLAFIAERWLRHTQRLVHNTRTSQKILSVISIIFSVIGAAGLILLTIFDTLRHHTMHDIFLALFIGGYVISAVFTCAEYQRLGHFFREFRILRFSFWMKLFFIIVEVGLAVVFGAFNRFKRWNAAAIVEWIIALIYSIYVLSFVIDFLPAIRTKHHVSGQTMEEQGMSEANTQNYPNGYANGYPNGHYNGVANDDVPGRYSRHSAAYPSGGSHAGWVGADRKQSPRGMV